MVGEAFSRKDPDNRKDDVLDESESGFSSDRSNKSNVSPTNRLVRS